MTSSNLKNFLNALEAVKKDYKCSVCSQFCIDPVTLSKCFHIICSEHFDGLKTCPICKTNLAGCTKFYDKGLSSCVNATKELDTYFEVFAANCSPCDDTSIPGSTNQLQSSQNLGASVKKGSNNPTNEHNIEPNKVTKLKQTAVRGKKVATQSEIDENDSKNKSTTRAKKKTHSSDSKSKTAPLDSNKSKQILMSSESNSTSENFQDSITTRSRKPNVNVPKTSKKEPSVVQESKNILNTSSISTKFNKANEKRNNKGETLLHVACRLGKIERITQLLKEGANPNTKDNAGWTPLHEVVQNGRLDLVSLLLQYNTLIDVPGQGNETPLHEAIRFKHEDIAVELVKHGADINARNCKGETPYQLASVDMKTSLLAAGEDIIQTQSLNVTHMSLLHSELDFDDIRVYSISQFRTTLNKLKALAKSHSNLHIETKFNKKVTHLIVDAEDGVCTSSADVLQGIANSLWILSSEWVTKSKEDTLESFDKYEVVVENKSNNGPKNSRYNKYKQLPGIFDGCHFYLHGFSSKYEVTKDLVLTKANLSRLITDAGGVILQRVPNPESIPDTEKLVPYHAKKDGKLVNCTHYIIFKDMFQPMYNMQHLKALPIGWLIECLEKYELCEPWAL